MVSEIKTVGRMRLLDMHAHLSCFMEKREQESDSRERHALALQELELRKNCNISTFFSSGTLAEWKFMQSYRNREEIFLSFGIHPWYVESSGDMGCISGEYASYSEESRSEALEEAFAGCDAIGEIGMDSVWCDVPLPLQRRSFEKQLQVAADLKKPVILHTKGMESEIAAMVRDFPEPVCVHWYSGDRKSFEVFLEADCYFTLGPDLADMKKALYRTMLREIPAERLFVETDGISAVAWARGAQKAELSEIPEVLARNMDFIAATKKMQRDELYGRMWENLRGFFRGTGKSEALNR